MKTNLIKLVHHVNNQFKGPKMIKYYYCPIHYVTMKTTTTCEARKKYLSTKAAVWSKGRSAEKDYAYKNCNHCSGVLTKYSKKDKTFC